MSPLAVLEGKLSCVRHMIYVVSGSMFRKMYDATKDKSSIDAIIKNLDCEAFDQWVKANTPTESLPMRELRVIAAAKQIPYYSRMDKSSLIKELKNAP